MSAPRHKLPAHLQAKVLQESPSVRFFFEVCGVAKEPRETWFAARMRAARELAAAEARATELGFVYTWEPDETSWDADRRYVVCCYSSDDAELEYPSLVNVHEGARPLACIGGIDPDYGDRLIKAELAIDALEAMNETWQAEADDLATRATYAARVS